MFIFDRCCRSSAAVTPVKYECDTNNLTGTSARLKILLTEKLTNGALVTPTPGISIIPNWRLITLSIDDFQWNYLLFVAKKFLTENICIQYFSTFFSLQLKSLPTKPLLWCCNIHKLLSSSRLNFTWWCHGVQTLVVHTGGLLPISFLKLNLDTCDQWVNP